MKYYAMQVSGREATIYIFGDIVTSAEKEWWGLESDVSSLSVVQEIAALDVDTIHVHINSYGGAVSEGLAIHNSLKAHKAKIITYCDGFACSAASVVFMTGDERFMYPASLLMIHNAWCRAAGNADELRKEAEMLETISKTAANAYKAHVNITDEELDAMLTAETWIPPEDALRMGFATAILAEPALTKVAASARQTVFNKLLAQSPEKGAIPSALSLEAVAETVTKAMEAAFAGALLPGQHTPAPQPPKQKLFNFKEDPNNGNEES